MSAEGRSKTDRDGNDKEELFKLLRQKQSLSAALPSAVSARSPAAPAPLSFSQQRLWLLDQIFPETTTLNMPGAVRLTGQLDLAALEASLNEVISRHESLRTTFADHDGQPVQVIARRLDLRLPLIDLSGLSGAEREAEVIRLSNQESLTPFDLRRGPLLRLLVMRLDVQEHVVLLNMHHIISDGWSMGVLLKEVGLFYAARVRGVSVALPRLSIQYADYAASQRAWLQGEGYDAHLSYWKRQLAGLEALELPTDWARPPVPSNRGARHILRLPAPLTDALKALSHRSGATLFMTLLAGFEILLSRYTNQQDIVIGTPIAGRNDKATEPLIGFFLNTLVLRVDLSGDPTFKELLARVREVTLAAYSHQDVPFEAILEALQPERDLSRPPLFQVFFNMLNFPDSTSVLDDLSGKINLPGLTVESVMIPAVESKFDLTLYVQETADGITATMVYNADLFSPARMAEMAEQFKAVLWQVTKNPTQKISRVSLLTPRMRPALPNPTQELAAEWRGAVPDLFRCQARNRPAQPAVVAGDLSIAYAELDGCTNQLAHGLRAAGIQKRDVVAIYAHRSPALVWAVMGVLKAGALFTILDPAYPDLRLIDYLDVARPRGWIQLEQAGPLPDSVREFVTSLAPCVRLELPDFFSAAAKRLLADYPGDDPGIALGPDDLAYIAFTSGSTGKPKGILGRHGPLSHFIPWQVETFGLTADDRYSMLSGISHDPLHRDMFTPLQTGATICIPDPDDLRDSAKLAEWLRHDQVTVAHLTPAMGQLLAEASSSAARPELESLRYAFFVGDMLTRRDVKRFQALAPRVKVVNYYGTTETQRSVSYFNVPDESREAVGPCAKEILPLGRGIKDVQLLVINSAKQLAGMGEVGEVYFRSPHLARGYAGDDDLTRQRFVGNWFTGKAQDRLYRTGDLGRYLPDGGVEALGRADLQVKVRGFRIEPGEIEATLGRHPSVKEAVVVAREDRAGERRLVAYVVFQQGAAGSKDDLPHFLKQRLPSYMLPSTYVALDALTLTPNGKVDRRALPAPEDLSPARASDYVPPRSVIEGKLAEIWADVLGLEKVGVHDNFFEIGGHSLFATRVVSQMRKALRLEVPLLALFESPTIAGFAEKIGQMGEVAASAPVTIVRLARGGPLPLSFAQQRLWFFDQLEPGSAAYNMASALKVEGRLNEMAMREALAMVVERHEVMRSTFTTVDGQPKMDIHARVEFSLPVVDLESLPPSDREAWAFRLAAEYARQPFDLAEAPLFRALLCRLDQQTCVLLFALHHIIGDGWSMGVLFREVAALYDTIGSRQPAPLTEPAIQYADYASWQRDWLRGETLRSQLDYWAQQLSGSTGALDLPTDRPRLPSQSYRGSRHSFHIGPRTTERLKQLSQHEGGTLFITLLAAFQSLLHLYTGQCDINVGTPIAGRRWAEVENSIGNFANTLVMRLKFSGRSTFRHLLEQARIVALGAFAHQDLPFEQLVEALHPDRSLTRNPLFQVLFALQDFPLPVLRLPHLTLTPLSLDSVSARFDLALEMREAEPGLACSFEYSTDLFDAESMVKMAGHFSRLLEAATDDPGLAIADLPALTEQERDQILARRRSSVQPTAPSNVMSIMISATFTAEPLEDSLAFWVKAFGLEPDVQFAPYNQVFQQLLDPSSMLSRHAGIKVLLVGIEDWLRDQTKPADHDRAATMASEAVTRHMHDLIAALKAAAERPGAAYIFCLLPPVGGSGDAPATDLYRAIEAQARAELSAAAGVSLIAGPELSRYPVENFADRHADQLGHIPFTPTFYAALGTAVARAIYSLYSRPYKVIAVDCDQTLWKGVCGEDGPHGIEIDEARRLFQDFLAARHREGMLICLCSKNEADDVEEVFKRRPEMPLKPEMLTTKRVNWLTKSANLAAIAAELQIGLDSFIFIDDNPVECAEVEAHCPEVLTLNMPAQTGDLRQLLDHTWAFDHRRQTVEDARRTVLYQQEAERERLRRRTPSIEEFVARLNLQIRIRRLTEADLARAAQLTQRTNQFNCTTIRRSEAEIKQLLETGMACDVLEVQDRFGDYGLVGLLIYSAGGTALHVETFLLSCRVLGRGVEHKVVAALGETAMRRGLASLDIAFAPSPKNRPARLFLESLAPAQAIEPDRHYVFTLAAAEAAQMRFGRPAAVSPPSQERPATDPSLAPTRAETSPTDIGANPALLKRIASELHDAEAIYRAVESARQWTLLAGASSARARTATEEVLTTLCEQVLHVEGIGVNDDFFAAGGHSLLATQLLSRVMRAFQVELSLRSFFESPTIAGLAQKVEATRAEAGGTPPPPMVVVERNAALPLSFSQQRVWVLNQIMPGNIAYNIPFAVRIEGHLEAAALAKAFDGVVARHEPLRTGFTELDGEPVQVIGQAEPFALPVIDLEPLPQADREARARHLAAEQSQQSFELDRPPLVRAALLRLREEEHILIVTMHHIISDGWSIGVLIRELAVLYNSLANGVSSPLPELDIQYADFAHWQRQWLTGDVLNAQLAYWRQALAGAPASTELPTDYPRAEVRTYRGARYELRLSPELTADLRALSRSQGVTLFMMLLTALDVVVYCRTGREDVVIATGIANRNHTLVEGLIGFFVNQLPLRTRVAADATFRRLLAQVWGVTVGAYAHQDLPFEKLIDELSLGRDLTRAPLSQIVFILHNTPAAALELPGLRFEVMEFEHVTARFDVEFSLTDTPAGLSGYIEYNSDLFSERTIAGLVKGFETVLQSAVTQPDLRVDELANAIRQSEKEALSARQRQLREANRKRLRRVRRTDFKLSPSEMIQAEPLTDQGMPLLITPAVAAIELSGWAQSNQAYLQETLLKHGAILFRGFDVTSVAAFERLAVSICPDLLDYNERSTPRRTAGKKVYTSTEYPAHQHIPLHNENSYAHRWPMKLLFCCLTAAAQGGETPIADSAKVFERLSPTLKKRMMEKRVMYVRNYGQSLDLSWQEGFQTDDRATVEQYCRRARIDCEWKGGDRLRTSQVRPAVMSHPMTGRPVWFNQAHLFHVSGLDPSVSASLLSTFGPEDCPRNAFYGDGSPIEASVLSEIRAVYQEAAITFAWQEGDVMLLDNMLAAHGRTAYAGPRRIVVAMGEPFTGDSARQDEQAQT